MELSPGYKQTEAGVIPGQWDVYRLGLHGETYGGLTGKTKSDFGVGDAQFVTFMNVISNVVIDCETFARVRVELSESQNVVLRDDLLFNGSSETPEEVAFCAVQLADVPRLFLNSFCFGFRFRERNAFDPLFLAYFFRSGKGRELVKALAQGSTRYNISKTALLNAPFGAPAVPEQRAIAATLSDVDALLGGLDRLIAKKRDINRAAAHELLTGRTRLHEFGLSDRFKQSAHGPIPEDWDVKPLHSVSRMNGRIGWQGLKQEEFTTDSDQPFLITGMNFNDGKIRWNEVYHIPASRYREAPEIQLGVGDVLMTKDGTIGKLLYVDHIPYPGRASLNSHLLVFRPIDNQYVPKFLFYQLGMSSFGRHIELYKSGSTFFGLTQASTGKYPVVLPAVAEQRAIAAVLSDMDAELSALEARRDKTRALKQAMMQELLTGRTRLV